jgi:predicted O-linked N-acetylglucosamine transferase (SPINDLY family)
MSRQERRRQEKEQAAALKRALATLPLDDLLDFGLSHHRAGRLDDAETFYRAMLARRPGDINACHLIGIIVFGRGDKAGALDWFRRARVNKPDHVEAAIFSGLSQMELGQLEDAHRSFCLAIALGPGTAPLYNDLGVLHLRRGDAETALAAFAAAVALKPESGLYWRNRLLTHNLIDTMEPARELEAVKRWSRQFVGPARGRRAAHGNDRAPDRRLRVGYVGGQLFGFHTQSNAFLPVIENHDPAAVDVFCYSDLTESEEDPITARYRARSTWRRTGGLDDAGLAAAIRADGIDVLIDTVGLVEGSRLLAAAQAPAPVSAMFPPMMSLGGETVDYLLADDHILPSEAEENYAERIERVALVYRWAPLVPAPDAAPDRPPGPVVFGSANNLSKVSAKTVALWARVLAAVPDARLLVKAKGLADAATRRLHMDRFAAAGIDPARVEMRGWTPGLLDHLAVFNEIDVALDTAPYGGVTTTCEALWMGVPVVTLVGQRLLGRYGLSLLRAVGLDDGIAFSADDYVARAKAFADDREGRLALHGTLRQRMAASMLCDGIGGARDLEAAYRRMWRRWCES